jgi:hypothetical protein
MGFMGSSLRLTVSQNSFEFFHPLLKLWVF